MTIRILIVDDSAVVRANLNHILTSDPEVQVIGSVTNGKEALAFIERLRPDVITMDIEMGGMDGFETTRVIMESIPIPIIIVSSVCDPRDQVSAFRALDAGAVACVATPPGFGHPHYEEEAAELIAMVKRMAGVKLVRRWPKRANVLPGGASLAPPFKRQIQLVAIGASTGGPPAVSEFLSLLPSNFPAPIVIVQHIVKGFVCGFVDWLNNTSPLPVRLAIQHEIVANGCVYVAPDDFHMEIGSGGKIVLCDDPQENHLRPSVSHLFRSVTRSYGSSAVGILLTGMGTDGAAELKRLRDAGGVTFAQDEASSLVHGMPGEAIRLGAAEYVFSPSGIATELMRLITCNQECRNLKK